MKEDMFFSFSSKNGCESTLTHNFECSESREESANDNCTQTSNVEGDSNGDKGTIEKSSEGDGKKENPKNEIKVKFALKCCNFVKIILNTVLSFSTVLFVCSVLCALTVIYKSCDSDVLRIGFIFLSVAFLVSSVVMKLKTDDFKWAKRNFQKSVLDSFDSNEIDKKSLDALLEILEMA